MSIILIESKIQEKTQFETEKIGLVLNIKQA